MTAKTGNILSAIDIKTHFRASSVPDADANESNIIMAKLTEKGFTILEVSLAARFLRLIFI